MTQQALTDLTTDLAPRSADVMPAGLVRRVRHARAAARAAEVELFILAAEWADAHPDVAASSAASLLDATPPERCPACGADCPATSAAAQGEVGDFAGVCPRRRAAEDPDGFGDPFVPAVAWHAAAPLAAALGRTTRAGRLAMRDSLLVRHRLPRLWRRVLAGQVEPWRARRIAALVVNQPRDVSDWLDLHVTPVAHSVGLTGLDRLLDEAMLRLHPEEREAAQLEELDRRHATLERDGINHTGIVQMVLRGDWADLDDFDRALTLVARALEARDAARGAPVDSLDVRRSRAVGVLADPEAALALLADPTRTPIPPTVTTPRREVEIVVHLTPAQLLGLDPVTRVLLPGRSGVLGQPIPMLTETIRSWCEREDLAIRVLPVLDLAGHHRAEAYEVPGRTARRVDEIAGSCAFPWCQRPAISCDHDHVIPYDHNHPDRGGATCECNLAPLCRHHHRLKTFTGWTYTPLEPGAWLWSDPHGQRFVRDHLGTRDVTGDVTGAAAQVHSEQPPHPPPRDGCRRTPAALGTRGPRP